MNSRKKKPVNEGVNASLYMDIINAIPDMVYWMDTNCQLLGCNQRFVKFFTINKMKDFCATPYEQMIKSGHWSKERVDAFKLDDLQVIFSREAQHEVLEKPIFGKKGQEFHFRCSRVPLLDNKKKVIGLVVVLKDISAYKTQEEPLITMPEAEGTVAEDFEPHVLMVEDNYIAQKVEEALLTSLHCHVDIAESGEVALRLFNPGKYDIVFMDISLEDTSGYVVAKKLRQMEKHTNHHVPIIALTTYQAEVIQYDCKEYFMDGVITKPLTGEQVQQIIQHFIHHKNIPVSGLKTAL